MDKSQTIKYLKGFFQEIEDMTEFEMQEFIINEILKMPYRSVDRKKVQKIMGNNYVPGLFWIRDRRANPAFLLEESEIDLDEWIHRKLDVEIDQLYKSEELSEKIKKLGKEKVISHAKNVLMFLDCDNNSLIDKIINQEYSDIFRRILMLILTGNSLYIFNNNEKFNELGKNIVPLILENTQEYDFRNRLFQSIASGLIGMDIKESNISTAPISLDNNFYIEENNVFEMTNLIEGYINDKDKIGIDCFEQYFEEVINGKALKMAWITDDYIETIFELKFIEEQLKYNASITFTLIPRYDSYSNDASYNDIMEMLSLNILTELNKYYANGRFRVCRNGMDISTFDGNRMSEEVYEIIDTADVVVISGARAYEMSQGMNKIVYYTGIAVCKGYTESITGFSKNSGKLIFLRQDKGERSFEDFSRRATRRMETEKGTIPVAGKTAIEYYYERYGADEIG